ncbi:MAG: hypothetical protein Q9222_001724 [Ikaeria aurantiellina]
MQHVLADLKEFEKTADYGIIKQNIKPILFKLSSLQKRAIEDGELKSTQDAFSKVEIKVLRVWPIASRSSKIAKLYSIKDLTFESLVFVPDRADLWDLFHDKVPLLDFTPDEVRKVQPLLECFPGARLLSNEVEKDVRQKCDSILRCIRHFSPTDMQNPRRYDHKIRNIEVYEVEHVKCSQRLQAKRITKGIFDLDRSRSSDANVVTTVETAGDVVLQQDQDSLRIYLTKDKSLQKKAQCHSIPELLSAELALPAEAKGLLASVLELDLEISSTILDEKSVARLPGADSSQFTLEDGVTFARMTSTNERGSRQTREDRSSKRGKELAIRTHVPAEPSQKQLASPRSSPLPSTTNEESDLPQTIGRQSPEPPRRTFAASFQRRNHPTTAQITFNESLTGSSDILKSIISSGKRLSLCAKDVIHPRKGESIQPEIGIPKGLLPTYPHSTIGFLGELFTVKYFSSRPPNFHHSINWTSRLRKRARKCPGFEDVTSYEKPEISDIAWEDRAGVMALSLQSLGYKPAESWIDKSVTYYIEVKTTIRDSSTPFIMSSGQMKCAKRFSQTRAQQSQLDGLSCYIIVRVYRILESSRHMRLYVDPYALMRNGILEKRSRQYAVVPGVPSTDETLVTDEDELADEEEEAESDSEITCEDEAADSDTGGSSQDWNTTSDFDTNESEGRDMVETDADEESAISTDDDTSAEDSSDV